MSEQPESRIRKEGEKIVYHFRKEQTFNLREGTHMDYKGITLQMIKKLHDINSWKKLHTFVKVLLEQQGD